MIKVEESLVLDGALDWDFDMKTNLGIGMNSVMLVAVFTVCSLNENVLLATDGPQDAPVATETRPETDMPEAGEAIPDKQDQDVPQDTDKSVDLEGIGHPLLGIFGLVVEVVGAILGDEINGNLDEAEMKILAEQAAEQLRPQLKAELEFVRLFCGDLTPEQRQAIKSAAEEAVKQVANKIARLEAQEEQGAVEVSEESIDPGAKIQAAIIHAMKGLLSDQQMALLVDEAEKRTAHRKQMIILNVVSQLDEQLILSEEQRTEIELKIATHWKPSWEKWISSLSNDCLPQIPDQYLVPFLSADQKVVWNGLQKVDFGWSFDMIAAHVDAEDWWGLEKDRDEPFKITTKVINDFFQIKEAGEILEEPVKEEPEKDVR